MTKQWDIGTHGTHGTPPAGVNFQRLRPYLEDALLHQKNKRVALAIAQRLDRNQWRAIAEFKVVGDDLDQVDLDSFSIRVEVETSDGWADLCTVRWFQLGMEWSDVTAAWDEVLRQHREGIQPGGPNDPGSARDGTSSAAQVPRLPPADRQRVALRRAPAPARPGQGCTPWRPSGLARPGRRGERAQGPSRPLVPRLRRARPLGDRTEQAERGPPGAPGPWRPAATWLVQRAVHVLPRPPGCRAGPPGGGTPVMDAVCGPRARSAAHYTAEVAVRAGPKAAPSGRPLHLQSLPPAGGDRVIAFIERYCRLPKGGKGNPAEQPIRLRDWQQAIIRGLYDRDPRPRQGLISVARKNGKSLLAACLGLYHLLADGERSAEVIIVSVDERTAKVIFNLCRRMVELDRRLSGVLQVYADRLYHLASDSVLEPCRASGHGSRAATRAAPSATRCT